MSETFIVMVVDREDSKHGEISVLEDAEKAERLVETLLEAGFEPSRIRVFTGRASEFQISHRPVVALVGDEEAAEGQRREPAARVSVAEESPVVEPAATPEQPAEAQDEVEAEGEEVAVATEAGTPVKFSSLFRSA